MFIPVFQTQGTAPPPLVRVLHEEPKFAPLLQNLATIY